MGGLAVLCSVPSVGGSGVNPAEVAVAGGEGAGFLCPPSARGGAAGVQSEGSARFSNAGRAGRAFLPAQPPLLNSAGVKGARVSFEWWLLCSFACWGWKSYWRIGT